MHPAPSTQPIGATSQWLEYAVFGLDRWLRRRQGVYEYTADEACLFRVQRIRAQQNLMICDGTRIACGDRILALHLWNEHMPAMAPSGPTFAWARQISRALDLSLRKLARYLAAEPALDDVVAIRADLWLGNADHNTKLAHIMAHYGFEASGTEIDSPGAIYRFGENILIFLLVMAANPAAIRVPALSRQHKRVYLSRRALERRYAARVSSHAHAGGGRLC